MIGPLVIGGAIGGMPDVTPLESSFLTQATWHAGTLTLTMNGRTYDYPDPSKSLFQGIATAPSPGAWLNENLKVTTGQHGQPGPRRAERRWARPHLAVSEMNYNAHLKRDEDMKTKAAKSKKTGRPPGRPVGSDTYQPQFDALVIEMGKGGSSKTEMAVACGITRQTLDAWAAAHTPRSKTRCSSRSTTRKHGGKPHHHEDETH